LVMCGHEVVHTRPAVGEATLEHEAVQKVTERLLPDLARSTEARRKSLLELTRKASTASEIEPLTFEITTAFDKFGTSWHEFFGRMAVVARRPSPPEYRDHNGRSRLGV